jgi:hypothetical protein
MREWWKPTAANYFGRIPKERLISTVKQDALAGGGLKRAKRVAAARSGTCCHQRRSA